MKFNPLQLRGDPQSTIWIETRTSRPQRVKTHGISYNDIAFSQLMHILLAEKSWIGTFIYNYPIIGNDMVFFVLYTLCT